MAQHRFFVPGTNFNAADYTAETDTAAISVGIVSYIRNDVEGYRSDGVAQYIKAPRDELAGCWAYLFELTTSGNYILHRAKAFAGPLQADTWNTVEWDVPFEALDPWPSGKMYLHAVYLPQNGYAYRSGHFGSDQFSPTDTNLVAPGTADVIGQGQGDGNCMFNAGSIATPSNPTELLARGDWIEFNSLHYGTDAIINDTPSGAGEPPANTVAPAVSGSDWVGGLLSCTQGTWTGDPAPTYAYQWQRAGANIVGATSTTYVPQVADVGQLVRCRVTATNSEGSLAVNSNAVTILAEPDKLTIAEENALTPGITEAEMAVGGFGDTDNQGFCREFSVNVGETAHFAVDSDSATEIQIVRVGWYGGVGFRLVDEIINTPTTQPAPATIPNSNGANTCEGWSDTAQWEIPGNATPGFYMAKIVSNPGPNASFMPFIVRDDDRPAAVMVKSSDSTWALAYNYWLSTASPFGGKSFYGSTGPMAGGIQNRAHAATYHKPIVTRQGIAQTNPRFDEWPLIRFLERNGIDVNYSACKDWRAGGPTLAECDIYISNGHDEYWSQAMRDKWYALRDAGKRLLFFGANIIFWRTRETDDGDLLWCFKDTMTGPGGHVAGTALDPVSWTGTWRDTRAANAATRDPERNLSGGTFRMNGNVYKTMVIPAGSPESQTPFWRDTNVEAAGLTITHIIGMEADEVEPQQPEANWVLLAATTVNIDGLRADDNGELYSGNGNMDWGVLLQRYESGGVVVSFNTCTWAWGLDNLHDAVGGGSDTLDNTQMQQATLNLLADLGAEPSTLMAGLVDPTPVSLDLYAADPGKKRAKVRRLKDGAWQDIDIAPDKPTIYVQETAPVGAPSGSLWAETDGEDPPTVVALHVMVD